MKNKKIIYSISILILCFIYPLSLLTCKKTQHYELSRFISPETCGGCHSGIYKQWKNSMHNLSHKDIVYKSIAVFLLKGLSDSSEIKEAESCVKCHTPVGYLTGFPTKTSDEYDRVPELAREGIQCDYCHSATGAEQIYNNDLKIEPGFGEANPGTKQGPFKDSESQYHRTAYSEFHTGSKICGTCHNVSHVAFDTKLETTYDEWFNSPYNKDPDKKTPCQGCHMYQRPGIPATGSTPRPQNPGTASDDGPKREHIFTHYFAGANGFVPSLSNDNIKAKMAEERLKNAAEISIDDKKIKQGKIIINVRNTGAGHYLPTGLTDVRQMWLYISIKNEKGKLLYSSGVLDKEGYMPENAIIYNTVFGDGNGRPVLNISKARERLKDRRIPPLESLEEQIDLSGKEWKNLDIEVKLLYRIAPQKIVDLVLGKGKMKLPVIAMTGLRKKIVK